MSSLAGDARYALRTFRRTPGFTATVVGTLGVGIAAATVIFAVVDAALYAKYDIYRDPGRLVYVLEQNVQAGAAGATSPRTLADWRAGAPAFEQLGGVGGGQVALVAPGLEPESVTRAVVTEDVLALLDARPAAGRLFEAREEPSPPAPVVLLAHGFWRDHLGGSRAAIGRTLRIDGRPVTVVGVLAPGFSVAPFLGMAPDLYAPQALSAPPDRGARSLLAVGRLRPDAKAAQAQAQLERVSAALGASDPAAKGWTPWLFQPRSFDMSGDAQFLIVLTVGVALVLVIVCANVANLLLARSAGRAREIATRLALGARRRRIARQLLTESVMLGLAGSLVGLFLSYCACRAVSWWIAGTAIGHLQLALDSRVLAAASLVSLLVTLGVGALPSLRLARLPISDALKDAGSLWGRLSAGRLRRMLAAGEVAMAVVLLLSAGLVLQGVRNLRQNDPGFRPENILTLRLTLSDDRYPDAEGRSRFVEEATSRLASRPGLHSVAATSLMPAIGGEPPVELFELEGKPPDAERTPSAGMLSVTPRYFETMRIPVLRGRAFAPADDAAALPAAVVSRGFAERWMEGRDPIGLRVKVDGQWRTIVGVAGDVHVFHLNVPPRPTIYLPYSQRPVPSFWLVMKTTGADQAALVAEARREIHAIDAEQPVRGGEWAASLVRYSMGGFDLTGLLVGVLAAVAVALAALGIYGVVAFSVARRMRELGIRIALGAGPGQVTGQVMREALAMALWGAAPGLLLALAAGRLLASKLHRVSPFDPALLAAVGVIVAVTVAAASWGPARRAARVDAVTATRME